jgi:hypothetical protein
MRKKIQTEKKNTIMIHDTHARISAYLEKELHAEVWMVKIYTHTQKTCNKPYIYFLETKNSQSENI